MLIRFARKALGFPSQQKVTYLAATRKKAPAAAQSVESQNDVLRVAQSLVYAQQLIQAQNSLASLVPNNAAIIKEATKARGTNKRAARKPAKKVAGRVPKSKELRSSDFLPVENNLPEPPKKPASTYLLFRN